MKNLLPVEISKKAMHEIHAIMKTKNIPEHYALRIGIKGGGCSGVSYMLGFDEGSESDDEYLYDGLKVIIDKKHMMYLVGKSLDFHEEKHEMGFVFLEND